MEEEGNSNTDESAGEVRRIELRGPRSDETIRESGGVFWEGNGAGEDLKLCDRRKRQRGIRERRRYWG